MMVITVCAASPTIVGSASIRFGSAWRRAADRARPAHAAVRINLFVIKRIADTPLARSSGNGPYYGLIIFFCSSSSVPDLVTWLRA